MRKLALISVCSCNVGCVCLFSSVESAQAGLFAPDADLRFPSLLAFVESCAFQAGRASRWDISAVLRSRCETEVFPFVIASHPVTMINSYDRPVSSDQHPSDTVGAVGLTE